jgi:uncharacterized protein YbjT (DUF2867 family)
MSHPVLVIGGTRGTGLLIARLLSQQGRAVRVLARDPGRAATLLDPTVEIVPGDITHPDTLPPALGGVAHIVFTAGCRSGRPFGEAQIIATEYRGTLNTLAAAQREGFAGRFLYMTASGVMRRSFASVALNLYKGNTLIWRRRAEAAIRASELDYTIIRTGVLLNRPGGQRAITLTQEALPLSPRYRIARADVAEAFVAALDHPKAKRATFEIAWGPGTRRETWSGLLQGLTPDHETTS